MRGRLCRTEKHHQHQHRRRDLERDKPGAQRPLDARRERPENEQRRADHGERQGDEQQDDECLDMKQSPPMAGIKTGGKCQ